MSTRRFLAPQARQGDGHGYLTQPQRPFPLVADEPDVVERIASCTSTADEPEAPSRAWVDANSELAAERNRLRLLKRAEEAREARRHVPIEGRIKAAQHKAKLRRMDVSREFFVIRKMFEHSNEKAATLRLERLEARLDGVDALTNVA